MNMQWEYFLDLSYFDLWAVRVVGNRNFEEVIHVINEPSAKFLCKFLNEVTPKERNFCGRCGKRLSKDLGSIHTCTPPDCYAIPQETTCSTHPDAPHGFCRDASHSADRYVCECEGWDEAHEARA